MKNNRLLITTQKLDKNSSYSFFLNWILELQKHFSQVIVICLEEKEHDLPPEIKVLSLGKEKGNGRLKRVFLFWRYIRQEKNNYDQVLVHMNPEYVCLGGFWWRMWGKKIGLWYMHKSVDFKLRVATKLVDIIFTGTKESFRLVSKKVKVVGHGILVDFFNVWQKDLDKKNIKFITISRISEVKNILELVNFASKFQDLGYNFELKIIGEAKTDGDREYQHAVKEKITKDKLEEKVKLVGGMNNEQVRDELQGADIFLHTGNTGSLDKSWLEACATGLPALSSNDASVAILKQLNLMSLVYDQTDELVDKVENLLNMNDSQFDLMIQKLRQEVETNHDLKKLINKIAKEYLKSDE
jgi:glycosyltransferase involved in cell wall biosynthesis